VRFDSVRISILPKLILPTFSTEEMFFFDFGNVENQDYFYFLPFEMVEIHSQKASGIVKKSRLLKICRLLA